MRIVSYILIFESPEFCWYFQGLIQWLLIAMKIISYFDCDCGGGGRNRRSGQRSSRKRWQWTMRRWSSRSGILRAKRGTTAWHQCTTEVQPPLSSSTTLLARFDLSSLLLIYLYTWSLFFLNKLLVWYFYSSFLNFVDLCQIWSTPYSS